MSTELALNYKHLSHSCLVQQDYLEFGIAFFYLTGDQHTAGGPKLVRYAVQSSPLDEF